MNEQNQRKNSVQEIQNFKIDNDAGSDRDFKQLFTALISQYKLSPEVAKIILERILIVMQEQHQGEAE